MKTMLRIARLEYQRNVFKRGFIMVLLSVPLMLALGLGSGLLIESLSNKDLPVGYLDQADFIKTTSLPEEARQDIEFIAFESEEEARTALEAGEVQAYLIVLPTYLQDQRVDLVYKSSPGDGIYRQIYDLFQYNLLAGQPPEIAARSAFRGRMLVRSADGSREFDPDAPTFDLMLPLFIGFAIVYMLVISSGYLMAAIAEEKENRTMEVLVTSVSTNKLLAGKVLGIVGISLTLIIVWTSVGFLCVGLARGLGVEWFQLTNVPWRNILTVVLIGIPTYVLAASLMAAIGATVTSVQEGQSGAGLFIILHILPIYLTGFMIEEPNNPLVIALSVAPFTALMGSTLRQIFGFMPEWQIGLAVGLQLVFAIFGLWLAGRAVRLGMLRYGQRLKWKNLFLRQGAAPLVARTGAQEAEE